MSTTGWASVRFIEPKAEERKRHGPEENTHRRDRTTATHAGKHTGVPHRGGDEGRSHSDAVRANPRHAVQRVWAGGDCRIAVGKRHRRYRRDPQGLPEGVQGGGGEDVGAKEPEAPGIGRGPGERAHQGTAIARGGSGRGGVLESEGRPGGIRWTREGGAGGGVFGGR